MESTNIGGHLKGIMVTYSIDLQERIVLTNDEAAEAFSCVRSNSKHQMKKAPRGALSSIVERAKQKYNIPAEVNISIKTVRSRARQGVCKVAHKGLTSPMEGIEDCSVKVASQLMKM